MIEITSDMKLPRLHTKLKLVKGEVAEDGTPTWRLYHSLAHQYYQIGWVEFEYLSRFSFCSTYQDLAQHLEAETTLQADEQTFSDLLVFLNKNGLLDDSAAFPLQPPPEQQPAWLTQLIHKYLFFSIPLVRPQKFLEKTYPYISFFFSKEMTFLAGMIFMIGVVMTLGRWDEFLHTFFDMFSWEGALTVAILFTIIKVFHELGHAYTAVKYGLNVPHMGVAFMVMYPILYTEATDAWHLASRRAKVAIGLAGIRTELILASFFLLLWNFSPPGMMQSIAFSVVAISLIGSLFVNLNPLMRFDGYFIASDALGIENLHARSFACARWWLRRVLFGWHDPCPEENRLDKIRFFIIFGWAIIIYRFFLFLGIAFLVYYLFMKPLGLVLMIIELLWFIGKPILSELKVWAARGREVVKYTRGKLTVLAAIAVLISLFLPLQGSISAPSVYHAGEYRDIYAPYPAEITSLHVREGQQVKAGDLLVELQSPELEKDLKLAQVAMDELLKMQRRQQTDADLFRQNTQSLEKDIQDLKVKIDSYERKRKQLTIHAAFDGVIKDTNRHIHTGRSVGQDILLFRLISPQKNQITAYVTEHQLQRVTVGEHGTFRPSYTLIQQSLPVIVKKIEESNIAHLDRQELSSLYGGPVYSERFHDGRQAAKIVPRQSLYKIVLVPDRSQTEDRVSVVIAGRVKIAAMKTSLMQLFFEKLYSFALPESDVI